MKIAPVRRTPRLFICVVVPHRLEWVSLGCTVTLSITLAVCLQGLICPHNVADLLHGSPGAASGPQ